MTVIDIVIIAVVAFVLIVVSRQRRQLAGMPAHRGFFAINVGLSIIALFYLADLLTMHLLPMIAARSDAMDLMLELHLNAAWVVALFGIGTISLGLVLAGRAMTTLIGDLEGREQQLGDAQRIGRIGHWRVRPDRAETEWSAEMYRIWGLDPAVNAPGLDGILDAIHPDDRDKVIAARDRAVSTGQPYDLEFRIVHKNGDIRHVRNEGRPEFDAQRMLLSVFGISQDITERKNAEIALRNSEEKFRNLIEGSRQGVVIGSRDSRVLFCNQAAADIYGYPAPRDIMALPNAFDLIAPHDRDRLREIRESRFEGGEPPAVFEFEGLRKNGKIVHIQAVQRALSWDGQPAIQYAIIDITARRAAEEALNQAQKMEAVGQLTGGVAHDFNNLLAVIMGNLELLSARMGEDPKLSNYATQALAATERGAELTQRLLAFSR